ncbi:MAG: hypothetical protein RH917_12615 [Lacipirellulaceae bacterium]
MDEHITVTEADGRVVVIVDDYELFDFVEDYLIEDCDFDVPEFTTSFCRGNRQFNAMHFSTGISLQVVRDAVEALSTTEIERIWRLNNDDLESG